MTELTGRQDAPVLLLTKLHPPFVPAQTVARERLFERLGEGRGPRLSLVAVPGRVRQVDAAGGVARARGASGGRSRG